MKRKKTIALSILTLIIVSLLSVVGFSKYRLHNDTLRTEKIASQLGYSKINSLAVKRSASFPMYDNIEVLFTIQDTIDSFTKKVNDINFEELNFFKTLSDHNFPPPPNTTSVASGLAIKGASTGGQIFPSRTRWLLRDNNKRTVQIDFYELDNTTAEWIYRDKAVGKKIVIVSLHRYK